MPEEFFFYTKGMTVGYEGVPLIKNIEIKVKRGEILTLIGPNGAGRGSVSGRKRYGNTKRQRDCPPVVNRTYREDPSRAGDLPGGGGDREISLYRKIGEIVGGGSTDCHGGDGAGSRSGTGR